VIMKVVHTDGMSQTERMQALNEANVLKVLQHPNIIRYIQNFENEGNLHLMMEYADDGSLDRKGVKTVFEAVIPIATKLQSFKSKNSHLQCQRETIPRRPIPESEVIRDCCDIQVRARNSILLTIYGFLFYAERYLTVLKSFLDSISHYADLFVLRKFDKWFIMSG
jgi:hypothetical protein